MYGWHSEIGHVPYHNGWQLSDIKYGQFDSYDFVTKADSTKWHSVWKDGPIVGSGHCYLLTKWMTTRVQFWKKKEALLLSPNQVNEQWGTILQMGRVFGIISQPSKWIPGYSFGNRNMFCYDLPAKWMNTQVQFWKWKRFCCYLPRKWMNTWV